MTQLTRSPQPGDSGKRERTLLADLVEGDSGAFWHLWRLHERRIIDVCRRRMSGAPADVDYAVSRSMFVALEKLPEHAASILNLEAWLTRLCCNVCIDIQRERSRASRGAVSVDATVGIEEILAYDDSPEHHCLASEIGALISDAMNDLRPSLRDAARLRFIDEASYDEIASKLSITVVNARKRVQQSRSILRARLRDLGTSRQPET
jgi:RNA polymerase sigma factor (sigma-70 family)